MQIQIIEYPINAMRYYVGHNRATNQESGRVSLEDRHDEGPGATAVLILDGGGG